MQKKFETGAAEVVDPDDAPELDEEWFANAYWEKGGKPYPPPPRSLQPAIGWPCTSRSTWMSPTISVSRERIGPTASTPCFAG